MLCRHKLSLPVLFMLLLYLSFFLFNNFTSSCWRFTRMKEVQEPKPFLRSRQSPIWRLVSSSIYPAIYCVFLRASNLKLVCTFFFKIHFNVILQLKDTLLKLPFRLCSSVFTFLFILYIIHANYMQNLPHPLIRELEMQFSFYVQSKSTRLQIIDCAE